MKVYGSYNGTGAAVYLCLGFVPTSFDIMALEDGDLASAHWDRSLNRASEVCDGYTLVTGTTYRQIAALTMGTGIEPYYGGDTLTSDNQTSVAYGEGVYLGWDDQDYRANTSYGCLSDAIDTWTLDDATVTTCSGHFNEDIVASGSRIGEGSPIVIQATSTGRIWRSAIKSVTGGQGEATSEVVLNHAVPSGKILKIGGMYSLAPLPLGSVTPAGILIRTVLLINVDAEIQGFVAECSPEDKV